MQREQHRHSSHDDEAAKQPQSTHEATTPPAYATVPAFKTVFCRQCGKPIDNDSKKCLGCGKQYFRGVKPMTFLCVVMVLALIALAAVCVVQEMHYNERIEELEQIIASYETMQ